MRRAKTSVAGESAPWAAAIRQARAPAWAARAAEMEFQPTAPVPKSWKEARASRVGVLEARAMRSGWMLPAPARPGGSESHVLRWKSVVRQRRRNSSRSGRSGKARESSPAPPAAATCSGSQSMASDSTRQYTGLKAMAGSLSSRSARPSPSESSPR